MNKKHFTDAISNKKVYEITDCMLNQQKTNKNFYLTKKIISTAAVFVLLLGFFNIPNVIAFISGLNFVPGIGLTSDNSIVYKVLSEPIDIECDDGTLTLDFVSKVSNDGRTDLSLFLSTSDLKSTYNNESILTADISAKGEVIASDLELEVFDFVKFDDGNEGYSYCYTYVNFPDIDEFDLTICGEIVPISLSEQKDNYVLTEENNDITLAMYKLNNRMIYMDVIDKEVDQDEYSITSSLYSYSFHNENDDEVRQGYSYVKGPKGSRDESSSEWELPEEQHLIDGGVNGCDSRSLRNQLMVLSNYNYSDIIKSIRAEAIKSTYYKENPDVIEIPIPSDGETIDTDIQVKYGKYTYEIHRVRREGNLLYLDDNCMSGMKDVYFDGKALEGILLENTSTKGDPGYEEAVINCDSYIDKVGLFPKDEESDLLYTNSIIGNFSEDAKKIKMEVNSISVIQYGNFNIKFE